MPLCGCGCWLALSLACCCHCASACIRAQRHCGRAACSSAASHPTHARTSMSSHTRSHSHAHWSTCSVGQWECMSRRINQPGAVQKRLRSGSEAHFLGQQMSEHTFGSPFTCQIYSLVSCLNLCLLAARMVLQREKEWPEKAPCLSQTVRVRLAVAAGVVCSWCGCRARARTVGARQTAAAAAVRRPAC